MNQPKEVQRNYMHVPNLLERSHGSRPQALSEYIGFESSELDGHLNMIPDEAKRSDIPNFPELSEFEVVRHYTQCSGLNFNIDSGFYPLGSCTMKYNPKINDQMAGLPGFASLHPYTPEVHAQGALEVMVDLQNALLAITGLKACSLHPAAGAHGELVGVKMMAAYHRAKGHKGRNVILVPDSAHGTNPASAAFCGMTVKQVPTGPNGYIEAETVKSMLDDTIAGMMITVPNTLGIFERQIAEIAKHLHDAGSLLYMDGANLNALVGQIDLGKAGVDVMHINLHKTFSTPHGGGGPGSGPVCVSERLVDFLPAPVARKLKDGTYILDHAIPNSVGQYRAYYGNFGMLVRALCYISAFGREHISQISEIAVLNANYIKRSLQDVLQIAFDAPSMHEAVFSDKSFRSTGVKTLDVAKRLLDFGVHPPTMYFPLIVEGAMMIEPTETESKQAMDHFIQTLKHVLAECKENPDHVKAAPHRTGIGRVDETKAARNPILTWNTHSES